MKTCTINHTDATKELSRKLNSNYIKGWCEEWDFSADTTSRVLGFYAEIEDPWEVVRYIACVTNAQQFSRMNADEIIPADLFRQNPVLRHTA